MSRHAVIGTAGHVDHGKTSLVRALTGVDCDRLPEEKRRGITIDLGFARWDLPGLSASVIDVPGHERFVQTMAAGASSFDLVLLVVAADDGVMPQTREHLAICEQLGVEGGIVAITKSDLVDEEMLALVSSEIADLTKGTFLEARPIVRCSAKEGVGLDELTREVTCALETLRAPSEGPPWLSIDRVFTKHGFGTIVTGTLVRGAIAVGDELDLMPSADGITSVAVRGLNVHDRAVERATASTRLALNLRGADRAQIRRGAVLTAPGAQRPTRAIDAQLTMLDADLALDARTELVLHVGSAHTSVRARSLGGGVVRLTAKSPFATHAGQRVIVRRPDLGAHRTIAGGVVVDPHPHTARRRSATPRFDDPSARVVTIVEESAGGATLDAIARRLCPDARVREIVQHLVDDGALLVAGERICAPTHLARAKRAVLEALASFHREHPALSGATAVELEGRLPASLRPLAVHAIAALVEERTITGGERVRLPAHDARALCERVGDLYREAGLVPISEDAIRERAGLEPQMFRDIVAELVRSKQIARLASGVYFHESALTALRDRVAEHFDAHETLSPGEFKSLTGLTRKHAILLLEWLDKRGVTRRRGDLRGRA